MGDLKDLVVSKQVWFVTGCSTGFGRALASYLLGRGNDVAVTARNPADIEDLTDHARNGATALILTLDVTQQDQIDRAVAAAQARFGRIDVLVNNAGIGYFASVEDSDPAQVRAMFDINLFGMGRMISAVLPGMRAARSGFIVNIASIAGITSFPAVGYYSASKFAVEGLSEALRREVESLGISVLVVEPSGFRTDWAGRSAQQSHDEPADYAATATAAIVAMRALSGEQAGYPVRAVHALVRAVEADAPPLHLLLGAQAFEQAHARIAGLTKDYLAWEAVTRGADGASAVAD